MRQLSAALRLKDAATEGDEARVASALRSMGHGREGLMGRMLRALESEARREAIETAFTRACVRGHLGCVRLIWAAMDPKRDCSLELALAAEEGHALVVRELIPKSDPKSGESAALGQAVRNYCWDCVIELAPVSDVSARDGEALARAAMLGSEKAVRALLPLCDPRQSESWALRGAANSGEAEILKLLIPLCDPNAHGCKALELALVSKASPQAAADCVSALLPVSEIARVRALAFEASLNLNAHREGVERAWAYLSAMDEKEQLGGWLSREPQEGAAPSATEAPNHAPNPAPKPARPGRL